MLRPRSLTLLLVLAACGAPGSDTVFTRALGRKQPASAPAASSGPARPRIEITTWRGLYVRNGEESRFQPCGMTEPLDVTGTAEGRVLLAERFRWNSLWQGRPMYGVLRGAVVTDTLDGDETAASDSLPPRIVRRFFVTGVDVLRTWENDCPGVRVPK